VTNEQRQPLLDHVGGRKLRIDGLYSMNRALPVGLLGNALLLAIIGCSSGGTENGNKNDGACATNDDCALTEFCQAELCAPLPQPQVEVGFTDANTDVFTAVNDDDTMPFFAGFQGLSELYFTVRVAGLPGVENGTAQIDVLQIAEMASTGAVLHEFGQEMVVFTEIEGGQLELKSRRMILDSPPGVIDAATLRLSFTLTAPYEGREIIMEVQRQVQLDQV
jgi:hypothetical protein